MTEKCRYCLEPMNDGATHCRGCGKRQPRPISRRTRIVLGVAASVVLGLAALFVIVDRRIAVENAFIALHNCHYAFNSHPHEAEAKDVFVRQIAEHQARGMSWREAYRAVAVEHGCVEGTGSRFLDHFNF